MMLIAVITVLGRTHRRFIGCGQSTTGVDRTHDNCQILSTPDHSVHTEKNRDVDRGNLIYIRLLSIFYYILSTCPQHFLRGCREYIFFRKSVEYSTHVHYFSSQKPL